MNAPPKVETRGSSPVAGDAPARIRLRGVRKVMKTERGTEIVALAGIDLDVADGEFIAVIGPSGCGKTTLLNQIAGLAAPTSGEILLGDRTISGPGRDRGVVFQGDAIFYWRTVRRNVEYGLEVQGMPAAERHRRADHYLAMVGLTDYADLYPKELSGGMRKRCQIAAVLANNPEVLLMDEPFGALDYPTKCQLQEEVLKILAEQPKSTIFVTHDIEEALFLADRVVAMERGAIRRIVKVPFSRPRSNALRIHPEFTALKGQLWELLEGPGEGRRQDG
jgi:NitT/TauT family transport system ATP-binding protein